MTTGLFSILGNVELDEACAARICWAILLGTKKKPAQYKPLFNAFPEVNIHDVHQEMLVAICRQWCDYDPAQSAPQTFYQTRATSAMIDLHRKCKSGKAKVRRVMDRSEEKDFFHHDESPVEATDTDTAQPLDELLALNLLRARKLFGGRHLKQGRKHYTLPKLIAIAMLMRRLKIGSKRARTMLLARPELCLALKLKVVPCHRSLRYAAAALRQFEAQNRPAPQTLALATNLPEKVANVGRPLPPSEKISRNFPAGPKPPLNNNHHLIGAA